MTVEAQHETNELDRVVARQIRIRLAARGENQAALARAVGKSQMWISERLNGNIQMTVNDLSRIAAALGVEAGDLLPGGKAYVSVGNQAPDVTGIYISELPGGPVPGRTMTAIPGRRRTQPTGRLVA